MSEDQDMRPFETEGSGKDGDVIDLRDLVFFWLKWFWVLIPFVVWGGYQGYQDVRSFVPKYEASMVVAPESGGGSGSVGGPGTSSVLRGFGLSLSGVGTQSETFERLKVVLGSIALAQRLQDKHELLQTVYENQWDDQRKEWRRPSGEAFERQERMRRLLRQNAWQPPNVVQLADFIEGAIQVETDRANGFSTLTFQHVDREFALEFLNVVYREADQLLREQDQEQSRARIAYVEEELVRTTNVDSRQTLFGILAGEQQKAMLLRSGLPYAARILDGPKVPVNRTEPNVRLTIAVPIALWVGGAFVVITLIFLFRRESSSRK